MSRAMAGIVRKIVQTTTASGPGGPYSQAVIADRTMYISGQVGRDPATGQLVPGGVLPETEQALKNMGAILNTAGATYNNVLKTDGCIKQAEIVKATVLLADINDFAAVNEIYVKYFPVNKPARAAYQAGALPRGARVEIEAIAVVGDIVDAPKITDQPAKRNHEETN